MKTCAIILTIGLMVAACNPSSQITTFDKNDRIKPWPENPRYWQYKGDPVLLLGATDDDNLFLFPNLEQHLDLLKSVGGNFIRNTMSSRDTGNVWPFYQLPDGKYDLERWNDEYWDKFETLLRLCNERDIIIQIEVWDRFDHAQEPWQVNPFNPDNNINYTVEQSGLKTDYPRHPHSDDQPLFHSIKGMPNYDPVLETVKKYLDKFVDKMLSHSLQYGNVLYCMNNETGTPVEWGKYWMNFIQSKAGEKDVYTTDMFNDFYRPQVCKSCLMAISNPDEYLFLDISQINSRNFGQNHWDTMRWIMNKREEFKLRPVNCTKVYGGNMSDWGSGTNDDGVERFFRNALGGIAAVRHHRPPSGNGLNQKAQASIKTMRKVESVVKLWDIKPQMELLSDRDPNEAYLSGNGETFVIYYPRGGSVSVDLTGQKQKLNGRWINVATGEWAGNFDINGESRVELATPDRSGGWFAVFSSSAKLAGIH
jgi:hypothetical protein